MVLVQNYQTQESVFTISLGTLKLQSVRQQFFCNCKGKNSNVEILEKNKHRPNAKIAAKKILFCLCANQTNQPCLKELFFCILSVLTRIVRLISTKTKQYFFGCHLCIRSINFVKMTKMLLFFSKALCIMLYHAILITYQQ